MVVSVERFLCIKISAGNLSGGIVHRQMEMPDLSGDPFIRSGIHLLQFAKISASGTSGMSVLQGNEICLYGIGLFLCFGTFLLFCQFFFHAFFLGFCSLWGEDAVAFQYLCNRRSRDMDVLMGCQQFGIMLEIRIIILGAVERDHSIAGCFRDGGRRLSSPIAMDKESPALFFVAFQHAVDMTF